MLEPLTSVFARIFSEGGLDLAEPGFFAINSPEDLAQRLDDLDNTPGNVTLTPDENGFTIDMNVVNMPVDGSADLDVSALGGSLTLQGTVDWGAKVSLHLRFGVDAAGFFIDPSDGKSELTVSNLQITSADPIAAGSDARVIDWGDGSGVPASGNNLVIVGVDNNGLLHIRAFDAGGNRTIDTDETALPDTQSAAIAALKQQISGLLPPQHVLTAPEKKELIQALTSILDPTLDGQLGFLDVELSHPKLTMDPGVSLTVALAAPDASLEPDGRIRATDLSDLIDLADVGLQGTNSSQDLKLSGTWTVSTSLPLVGSITLPSINTTLTWANLDDPLSLQIGDLGQLKDIIHGTIQAVNLGLTNLDSVANFLGNLSLLNEKIPVINKSINDLIPAGTIVEIGRAAADYLNSHDPVTNPNNGLPTVSGILGVVYD